MMYGNPPHATANPAPLIVRQWQPPGAWATIQFPSEHWCRKRTGWRHLDGPCTDACPFGPEDEE
jgi:hypothetical protein